ncbi:MAG: TRC40/GET3/ArsA family transport-energizing ATPase [Chloroflexi bacterium]|jgi:arsenite-transporting ATPase|nr:TRC40/GET3/ArsA family transport-energizing ATPase [Chloroflexota bacterium]
METEFIFFSGKGGVGKTSMACATAVHYAEAGRRTLIVTTDPAANLADVFEQPIGHHITPLAGIDNLWAMEIDPDRATEEYKERALAPLRAAFPPEMVAVIDEQMSGPCTAEVAAFDRFTDFLVLERAADRPVQFDVVIFDTAPTGHTIRLLELPAEWSQSISAAEQGSGQTCIGPAAAIQEAKHKYERALAQLRDGEHTRFIFVLHPEAIALHETARAIGELRKLDIQTYELIVNGIIPPAETANELMAARAAMQAGYLQRIESELPYPTRRMFLLDGEIKGLDRLRGVAGLLSGETETLPRQATGGNGSGDLEAFHLPSPQDVLPRVTPDGHSRTLFFAGKGGVGKTVASCVTAVWLARQGYRTLLLTTDPAAHLGDVLGEPVGNEPAPLAELLSLWAAKIDPKKTADAYKKRILDDARERGRPEASIRVMAEELDSPCTEEIAAFDRFIEYASEGEWDAIVFDTAPTGHTLRLLELPVEWSKQLDVKVFSSVDTAVADDMAKQRFAGVIDMMRDPERSTFAFVMYPEATPIIEAYRASQELATLEIPTGLVVANLVIPPEQANTPFTRARRAMQERYLAEIQERFAVPVLTLPLLPREVTGLEMLAELGKQMYPEAVVA